MEEYLNNDDEVQTAYSKNIARPKFKTKTAVSYQPNESGFDIQEALNIKEDLAEVMKGFDFFDDIPKDKKK